MCPREHARTIPFKPNKALSYCFFTYPLVLYFFQENPKLLLLLPLPLFITFLAYANISFLTLTHTKEKTRFQKLVSFLYHETSPHYKIYKKFTFETPLACVLNFTFIECWLVEFTLWLISKCSFLTNTKRRNFKKITICISIRNVTSTILFTCELKLISPFYVALVGWFLMLFVGLSL